MFRKSLLLTCIISSLSIQHLSASYLDQKDVAVICVPVANCLGIPAQDIDPSIKPDTFYEELPCSPENGPYSCARIHQCLFNEVGIIKERKGDELLVEFPHFFYVTPTGSKESSFWVHASSVQMLEELPELHEIIPEPLSPARQATQEVLTLCQPWYDKETNQWYSVGTRFLRASEDTETQYAVWCMDYEVLKPRVMLIDKEQALIKVPQSTTEAKKLMVALLRSWASQEDVIPYIWGGCSIGPRCPARRFILSLETRGNKDLLSWRRQDSPQYGCDCSGLLLRAAQVVGFNYFCKNTTTIGKEFSDVKGALQEGDLLLMKGHVMVISSLEENLVLDAVSYSSGYGCVRELRLRDAFEGVETYDDLLNVVATKEPLKFKNRKGKVISSRGGLRIIRLTNHG